jgi:UDPglucose 6-dehydrogenase
MKIAVIGLGKLGLPLALLLSKRGHDVLGIDTNKSRINAIKDGIVENEPGLSALLKEVEQKKFEVTNDFGAKITECDLIFLILPTPSKSDHKFSSELIKNSILEIVLKKFKSSLIDICIVSTVNPGDSREIEKYISKSSIDSETIFNLYYSPEFIALGTIIKNMENPDSILLGEHEVNSVGGDKIIKVLKTLALNEPKICRMSLTSAEITKIAINSFVTTKISFANFIGELADKFEDADKFSVLQSVGSDSRIGEKYLRPGLGFGGPCFPRDNRAIAAMAQEVGVSADISIATDKVNIRQPEIRANEISKYFNFDSNKKILILGLSYKSGSYVVEESQAIMLANELNSRGFEVSVYDPISIDFATDKLSKSIKYYEKGESTEKFDLVIDAVTSPDFRDITSTIPLEKFLKL